MNNALAQLDSVDLVARHATGRPMKFQSLEQLQDGIDRYFADCEANNKPFTITGLCLSLDTTRETICDYQVKPVYSDAIKRAKERVASYAEEHCYTSRNPAGAIFLAKNHGFRDTQQLDITTRLTYDLPDQVKALTAGDE